MLIDYNGFKYFMIIKKLTLKQVCWAKFLLKFNFVISYQNSKKNKKVNTLTKKPYKISINNNNKCQ